MTEEPDTKPPAESTPAPAPEASSAPTPAPAPATGSAPAGDAKEKQTVDSALSAIVQKADAAAGIEPPAEGTRKRARKRKRKPKSAGATGAIGEAGATHPVPQPGKKKGKKRKKGGGSSPTAHANDAIRSLSDMLRSVFDSQKVHFLSRPRYTELNLRVPIDARMDGPRCANKLVEAVLKLVNEVRENDNALATGSVYCYFSESAEAEGCRPTEPREVFDGYGSTGRPKFSDFVTMAIERKSADIDKLLAGDEVTITHVTQGRVLRTAQLAEFGKASPVFRILGQVDAGLFAIRGQEAKVAFSFQVLLGKDLQGQPILRLHPVGQADVLNLLDHSVPQILQRFQGDLDEAALRLAGRQKNGDETDEEDVVLPMLQDLAKKLEDRARHRSRRTEHAERRAAKSNRPTAKAYDEALAVADDNILWDDQENTVVVVGPHNRVHVFTPEATHVTSMNMNRANVQQRLKTHRWRNTEPGERGGFRMQLRALVKDQKAQSEQKKGRAKKKQEAQASDQLQSKIAGLMAGLGGGAATPPAEDAPAEPTTAEATSEATAEATSEATPAVETPATDAASTDAPATEAPAPEAPAAETKVEPETPIPAPEPVAEDAPKPDES